MFEESVAAAVPSLWESMSSWFTPTVLFVLLNLMIGTIALTSTLADQNKQHNNQTENHPNKLARAPSLLQRVRSINFYAYRQEHQQQPIDTKAFTSGSASSDQFGVVEEPQKPGTLEDRSHYLFEESHQEVPPQDSDDQFSYFQQQQQENGEVMDTQYQFEQTQDSSAENLDGYSFGESGVHHLNQESVEDGEEEEAAEDNEDGDKLQSLEEVFSKVTGHHVRTKSDTVPSSGEVPVKLPRKMRKSASAKSAFRHFEAEDVVETRRPETVREKVAEPDEEVDAKADDFINKFKQQLKLQRIDSITRYKEMITRGSAR